jgi:O-antigen ligase
LIAALVAVAAMLVLIKRYRLLLILAMLAALAYFLSPAEFQNRFRSGFDPNHPHTRPRIELFKTGIRIIRAHPMLGVGPKSVEIEAPKYKSSDSPTDWTHIHLHNNFLQIAAERGIPGLILWLWFMVQITLDSWRRLRLMRTHATAEPDRERFWVSGAAFGACIALLTGGLLEYNFGDSEVLMLFLFMASAPYADDLEKGRKDADIARRRSE